MTIIYRKSETIWPCIRPAIEYLRQQRTSFGDKELRAGVNFSIIFSSACFLEGVFETTLKALLALNSDLLSEVAINDLEPRRTANMFHHRLDEDLEKRVERCTGAEAYSEVFELLTGYPMKALKRIKPLWEGATVLFYFRHALAHGREVSTRERSGAQTGGMVLEKFSGGYSKVEAYLIKVGLLDTKFVEKHSGYIYLRDRIADHFWNIAQEIPSAVAGSLEGLQRKAIERALIAENAFGKQKEQAR